MSREREENPRTEGPLPGICTALILQSPVSTWIADRDGTNVFENEAARRLFGIERDEEVVGKYNIFKDDVLIAGGFMPQIRKIFEEGGSAEIIVDYDFSRVEHVEPGQPTHRFLRGFLFAIKDQDGRVRNVIVQHEDWTERISTEEALKKSQERYRDLAEGMSDWIWEVDAEGRCTYSNSAVESILGYTPEEVIGKPIMEFILPEYREEVSRQMGQAAAEGRGIVGSLTGERHKDGSIRYIETNAKPVLDEGGNLAGIRGMNRDVTARVRAEQSLEREKARFQALIENASDIITVMSADRVINYISPSVELVMGYKPEEVVGRAALDDVHPDDVSIARDALAAAIEHEPVPTTTQFRLRRRDGAWRMFDMTIRSLLKDPSVGGIVVNQRDITERKAAEDDLRQSEATNRAVLSAMPDLMFRISGDGVFLSTNRDIDRRFFVPPDEFLGKAVGEVLPEHLAKLVMEYVGRTLRTGEIQTFEYDLPMSGLLRRYEARMVAMGDNVFAVVRDITERKQAEEALRETYEQLRAVVDTSPLGMITLDLQGTVTGWNPAAEKMFGWKAAEVTGKPIPVVSEEEQPFLRKAFEQMAAGQTILGVEVRPVTKDGRRIEVSLSVAALHDPNGELTGFLGMTADITERKRAEEALRNSTEQLGTIIATSPLAIVTLDLDGKVTSWNPAAENMFGWAAQEVIGKPMPNLPDDQLPVLREFIQRLLRGEILNGEEVPHIRKDGTRVDVSVSVAALHDPTGATIGFMGMLADITERKRAEEALRESEERYRQLVEMMNEGLAVADGDYRFSYANNRFCEMLGYRPEEMIGRSIAEFVHEDARSTFEDQMARRKRGEAESFELAWSSKDGRTVYTLVSPRPVFDQAGNFAGSIAALTDITERKRAEEAAQRKQQEVITLLNTVPGYVFWKDAKSVYITANEVFAKAVGVPVSEIPGKTDYDLFPEELAEKYRADDGRLIEAGTSLEIGEEETVDGARRLIVETRKVPIKDDRGNVIGLIGIALDVTERKQAEEALKESEERFRALTENSSDIVMVVSAEGNIMYVSPAVGRILGYGLEEMIGTPIFNYVHPDDAARGRPAFRELAQHEGMTESGLEFRLRDREGSWHIMEVTGKTLLHDPAVGGIIINHRDITESVEAEQRARELEEHRKEFYRKTIEAATEGKLVITEANEIKEIAGRPIAQWEIKSGEDLSVIRQAIAGAARSAGMDEDRVCDFILAVGELTTNAYKHAGGGKTSLHRVNDSLMVVVSDEGKGMEALSLPEVALVRGYSTVGSLGMGYKAVLSISDKAFLATGPTGTTVAIKMRIHPAESPAMAANLPDTWKS
jgi:PAS domain S-box-containing protein